MLIHAKAAAAADDDDDEDLTVLLDLGHGLGSNLGHNLCQIIFAK
jgi:hypothetical protein